MANTFAQRMAIGKDTMARSESITQSVPGASLESVFFHEQIAPESLPPPNADSTLVRVKVVNSDSFTAARNIMKEFPKAHGGTAVLNLASDAEPAGGWAESFYRTQEEALCYSSTLYATLKPSYYPWPNLGPQSIKGIYSPAIVIFKDDLANSCVELPREEWRLVSVITVAAPRGPRLKDDERLGQVFKYEADLLCLREKIKLVYRMAVKYKQEYLVLAAMGCGAYRCPPRQVAEEMKATLMQPEFKGRFREIVFAVYSKPDQGYDSNFEIFSEVFNEVTI
ncbi:hypothetical protein BDY19DRAFT_1066984 [Irpex rosettiformis]|uniref:Uncharacterized protein n=1 Tax=Irpex rosettiformis TaxID=378272 RepID=A0ACB8UBD8_9APHY|nr:hypothetical protein BDY19DRAFT_1066984 [Irpex rosettiformis]